MCWVRVCTGILLSDQFSRNLKTTLKNKVYFLKSATVSRLWHRLRLHCSLSTLPSKISGKEVVVLLPWLSV